MLNLFGARERDAAGYAALAGAAGLAVERRLPVGPELTGLVLAPIASGPVSC
jgi:hypothetical protein